MNLSLPAVYRTHGPGVLVHGPASISNLGPGFDALGLCIREWGDQVEAWQVDAPGVHLVPGESTVAWQAPLDVSRNTAAVAARRVLAHLKAEKGMVMRICKGLPPGSGLGSSAASAVAGAWAANVLCGTPLSKVDLIEAVLAGETVASGSRHGDNVLPALFGGLVLVSGSDPVAFRSVPLPDDPALAVILPEVQVLTRQARAMLPKSVPLTEAVRNATHLAFMIDAFRSGDWETVGRCMMADRIVEPLRARLVPCYDAVKGAALEAGAFGCGLSGSGPAMFAVAPDVPAAENILAAMLEQSRLMDIEAKGIATGINRDGVRSHS